MLNDDMSTSWSGWRDFSICSEHGTVCYMLLYKRNIFFYNLYNNIWYMCSCSEQIEKYLFILSPFWWDEMRDCKWPREGPGPMASTKSNKPIWFGCPTDGWSHKSPPTKKSNNLSSLLCVLGSPVSPTARLESWLVRNPQSPRLSLKQENSSFS